MKYLLSLIVTSSICAQASCLSPSGATMQPGDTVLLFTTEYKPDNSDCLESIRECQADGLLSGNKQAIHTSCLNEKTCEHPFSLEPMSDAQTVVTFKTPEPPCITETRICDGSTGLLSGSFVHNFCDDKKNTFLSPLIPKTIIR